MLLGMVVPFDGVPDFLYPLLRHAPLIVEPHHMLARLASAYMYAGPS